MRPGECARQSCLLEPVLPHADVQVVARQTKGFRGLGLVEARLLKRLLDHHALHRVQIETRRSSRFDLHNVTRSAEQESDRCGWRSVRVSTRRGLTRWSVI